MHFHKWSNWNQIDVGIEMNYYKKIRAQQRICLRCNKVQEERLS